MGNHQLCFHLVSVSGLLLFSCLLSDKLSCYFLSPGFYFIYSGRVLTALCLWRRVYKCVYRCAQVLAFYVDARELDLVLMLVEQALCQVGRFPAFTP